MVGEADRLRGHQLCRGLRSTLLVEDYTKASENPPRLFQPEDPHDQKGVFHHGPRWLPACDRNLETGTLAGLELRRRGELPLLGSEPTMGETRGQEGKRLLTQVLDIPGHQPPIVSRPGSSGNLLNAHLGAHIAHGPEGVALLLLYKLQGG